MLWNFEKYHNLGNDFIIIDDEKKRFPEDEDLIKKLCSRNFGIGADGIILLRPEYRMRIFNSDGSMATSCGNALLCLVKFLYKKTGEKQFFIKTEKETVFGKYDKKSIIEMGLPKLLGKKNIFIDGKEYKGVFVFSGTYHFVLMDEGEDILYLGKKIREDKNFKNGTNVCFVRKERDIFLRVYEKGVEGETYACGTGALAACFVLGEKKARVRFLKGSLEVSLDKKAYLSSFAERVYKGSFFI